MAIIMKKYTFKNKTYLVFDQGFNHRNLSSRELALVAQDEAGVSVDEIIIVENNQINFINKYGCSLDDSIEILSILKQYKTGELMAGTKEVEVRFTNGYIEKIINLSLAKINIA